MQVILVCFSIIINFSGRKTSVVKATEKVEKYVVSMSSLRCETASQNCVRTIDG